MAQPANPPTPCHPMAPLPTADAPAAPSGFHVQDSHAEPGQADAPRPAQPLTDAYPTQYNDLPQSARDGLITAGHAADIGSTLAGIAAAIFTQDQWWVLTLETQAWPCVLDFGQSTVVMAFLNSGDAEQAGALLAAQAGSAFRAIRATPQQVIGWVLSPTRRGGAPLCRYVQFSVGGALVSLPADQLIPLWKLLRLGEGAGSNPRAQWAA